MIAPNTLARPSPLTKPVFVTGVAPLLPYFVALQARVYRETGNPFEGSYRRLARVEALANLAYYYGSDQFLDEEFAAAKGTGLCKISRRLMCPVVAFKHPLNPTWWIGVKFNAVDDQLMPGPKRSENARAILAQHEFTIPLFGEPVDDEQDLEMMRIVAWVHCGVRIREREKGIPMISFSYVVDADLVWSLDDVEVAATISGGASTEAKHEAKVRPPLWKPAPSRKEE